MLISEVTERNETWIALNDKDLSLSSSFNKHKQLLDGLISLSKVTGSAVNIDIMNSVVRSFSNEVNALNEWMEILPDQHDEDLIVIRNELNNKVNELRAYLR
jgi:hypothetical protein